MRVLRALDADELERVACSIRIKEMLPIVEILSGAFNNAAFKPVATADMGDLCEDVFKDYKASNVGPAQQELARRCAPFDASGARGPFSRLAGDTVIQSKLS